MKQFNIKDYLKNPSCKVVTRDGKSVKIHCTNYYLPRPVIAEVEGLGYSMSLNSDGKYYQNKDSQYDLFFVPEKHERWVNIYHLKNGNDIYVGGAFQTELEAKKFGSKQDDYIATVRIEWEE